MKKVVLLALLCFVASSTLFAGNFTSSNNAGDFVLGFRKSTAGTYDLVVDVGQLNALTNNPVNTRIPIAQYTTNQLFLLGLNSGLIWAGWGYYDTTVTGTSVPGTIFATKPRTSLNTQTTFSASNWKQNSQLSQEFTINQASGILAGAQTIYGISPAYNALNTSTAALEPSDASGSNPDYTDGYSYTYGMLDTDGVGDFAGDFAGYPENTCPSSFSSGATIVRSDLWQIPPTTYGSPTYLGYFELNTNGLMTFVAYGVTVAGPTVPVIKSMGRTNGVSYVNFTTGSTGTYTLRGTNILNSGTASTNWPAITSVSGNGSNNTLQDTTSSTSKFYIITAQ